MATSAPTIFQLVFHFCRHAAIICYGNTTISSCRIAQTQLYPDFLMNWHRSSLQANSYLYELLCLTNILCKESVFKKTTCSQKFAELCPKTPTNHFQNWQRCLCWGDTDLQGQAPLPEAQLVLLLGHNVFSIKSHHKFKLFPLIR